MIQLVIKGGIKKAHRAAKRRKIKLTRCRRSKKGGAVRCDAPCNKYGAVARWYGADTGAKAPYKAGTLLWYNDRCTGPAH